MSKTTDDAVMELLVAVEKKKQEIAEMKKRPQWLTNCSFAYDAESSHGRVNIQTRRDVETLLDFYAFLLQREEYFNRAAEELTIGAKATHLGFSISDWKSDIKTRLAQLLIEEKQQELEVLDKRVNKLVSPEQRREMELKALQKLLA